MPLFSCLKCSYLSNSYAACFAHMSDSPHHEADRTSAIAEAGRRGLRSALENMITILQEAPPDIAAATMTAGREAIIDASPLPRAPPRAAPVALPAPAAPAATFQARIKLLNLHRYTAAPAPAGFNSTYELRLRLPVTVPKPTFIELMTAISELLDAKAPGHPAVWWGLMGATMVARVWTRQMVVKTLVVKSDGGVRRMIDRAAMDQLHSLVLGEGEGDGEGEGAV